MTLHSAAVRSRKFGPIALGLTAGITSLALLSTVTLSNGLANGVAADGVLGQPDFTSNAGATSASSIQYSYSTAVDSAGRLWVADCGANRVLRFDDAASKSDGASADGVLGQPDFTSDASAATREGMDCPSAVAVDSAGRLWVADLYNARVLRFDDAANKVNGANADGVLGQPNFTSKSTGTTAATMNLPLGLAVDQGGRVWVSDSRNNRVLRFDDAAGKADGASADAVLGQDNFTGNLSATTAKRLNSPWSLTIDSAGRLWVADYNNRRVLRFDDPANKANGADADGVLGQANFTTSVASSSAAGLGKVGGVAVDSSGRAWVVDSGNNRLVWFDRAAAKQNGASADGVIGQLDLTGNSSATSRGGLNDPIGATVDHAGQLWVADYGNSRALRFGVGLSPVFTSSVLNDGQAHSPYTAIISATGMPAPAYSVAENSDAPWFIIDGPSGQAGGIPTTPGVHTVTVAAINSAGVTNQQFTFTVTRASQTVQFEQGLDYELSEGSTFVTATASSGLPVVYTSTTPLVCAVTGNQVTFIDAGTCWIAADQGGDELYLPSSGQAALRIGISNGPRADGVLGSPDFKSNVYTATASGSLGAYGSVVDNAGRLWVADCENGRVLRFDNAAAKANGAPADGVLGQPDFTTGYYQNGPASIAASATASNATARPRFGLPGAKLLPSGGASDGQTRRISAMSAMNGFPITPTASTIVCPTGLTVDSGGRLWVADLGLARVLRFDDAASKPNGSPADGVLGQPDFASFVEQGNITPTAATVFSPFGLTVDISGTLWVSDLYLGRVLRFDNAASKANGADADGVLGQPDFSSHVMTTTVSGMAWPAQLAVDQGGRLWVSDYFNSRVLRFDNAASKANGAGADGVLGQPDFTSRTYEYWNLFGADITPTRSTMLAPLGVAVDLSGRVWVSDFLGRVLWFNDAAQKPNGADADGVLGQPDFGHFGWALTRSGFIQPFSLAAHDTRQVWVSDGYVGRVLRFDIKPAFELDAAPTGVVQMPYSTTLSAHGLSTPTYTVSLADLPPGLAFDETTGALSGTPTVAGVYTFTVTATNSFGETSREYTVIIAKIAQAVTFDALPDKTLADPPFNLVANASSWLPITFSSATPWVCTVDVATVTIVAAGNCTISADQTGDAFYAAAARVTRAFAVASLGTPTVTGSGVLPGGQLIVTGTALPGAVLTVTLTPQTAMNAGTAAVAYRVLVDGSGHWVLNTRTAIPVGAATPINGFGLGAQIVVSVNYALDSTGTGTSVRVVRSGYGYQFPMFLAGAH